ncbi:flippase [Candidatus Bathyarchaeota archaeon]|nr:flippase [Candidatus Bathyarchaeota archaeon]
MLKNKLNLADVAKQSAKGSVVLMVGQVLSTVILALGSIILARLLESANYGIYTVAHIPISVMHLFGDLGVNSALVKYISQYRLEEKPVEVKRLVKTGLTINALINTILSFLAFLLSDFLSETIFHEPQLNVLIKIGSLGLLAQALMTTCQSIFIAFDRMELHSLTNLVFSILKSIISPILVIVGYGVFGATVGSTLSYIVTVSICISIIWFFALKGSDERLELETFKKIIHYGYPLFLSNLISGGLTQLFNFLMAIYVESSMIGNYQAAVNFSVLIGFILTPITTVLFPLFSKFDAKRDVELEFVFQSAVKYSSILLVPATMGLIVLADPIVRIIYGETYQLTPFFLQLCIINTLFVSLGTNAIPALLNSQGKTKINFVSNLLYFSLGLPLSLVLIPKFGIIGLLSITIIASKPSLIYLILWVKRNFGFTIDWQSSFKIFIASSLAFLIVYAILRLFPTSDVFYLIIGIGVFLLVYSILLPSIRAIESKDIHNLKDIMKGLGPLAPLFDTYFNFLCKFIRTSNHDSEK